MEPGVVDDMSSPPGQVTVMCGHGERAMTAATATDAGSTALGLGLEVGP